MPKYLDISDFYAQQPVAVQPLLYALRDTIAGSDEQLREAMRYNTAFFIRKSWVCYVGKIRPKTGIEIVFARSPQLSNEHGLLEQHGRAALSGITFADLADFQKKETALLDTLQEALLLDDLSKRSAAAEILSGKGRKIT
jgi:hypothetical protein